MLHIYSDKESQGRTWLRYLYIWGNILYTVAIKLKWDVVDYKHVVEMKLELKSLIKVGGTRISENDKVLQIWYSVDLK